MPNVHPRRGPVKRQEVVEISGLLAELIRTGEALGGSEAARAGAVAEATAVAEAAAAAEATAVARVSPHMIRAAVFIHENGPQTIGQLAAGVGISQGWASRIVDDLERAGYVERERDLADRRVVRVGLTAKAADRVGRAARWRGDAVEAALADMGPAEKAAVATFLRRFLERSRQGA